MGWKRHRKKGKAKDRDAEAGVGSEKTGGKMMQ